MKSSLVFLTLLAAGLGRASAQNQVPGGTPLLVQPPQAQVQPPVTFVLTYPLLAVPETSPAPARVRLTLSRPADTLQVLGQPKGMTVTVTQDTVTIETKGAPVGQYPLRITGRWGNETKAVELLVSVYALDGSVPAITGPAAPGPVVSSVPVATQPTTIKQTEAARTTQITPATEIRPVQISTPVATISTAPPSAVSVSTPAGPVAPSAPLPEIQGAPVKPATVKPATIEPVKVELATVELATVKSVTVATVPGGPLKMPSSIAVSNLPAASVPVTSVPVPSAPVASTPVSSSPGSTSPSASTTAPLPAPSPFPAVSPSSAPIVYQPVLSARTIPPVPASRRADSSGRFTVWGGMGTERGVVGGLNVGVSSRLAQFKALQVALRGTAELYPNAGSGLGLPAIGADVLLSREGSHLYYGPSTSVAFGTGNSWAIGGLLGYRSTWNNDLGYYLEGRARYAHLGGKNTLSPGFRVGFTYSLGK